VGRDTNFYYSFLVLPADKRRAIVAVWDFCRAVDDAVDEPGEDARGSAGEALASWRDEVARCFEATTPTTEQGRALQPLISRFHLPRRPFEDLIDGVAMDAMRRRYRTFDELREYCYRVASTVGLICLEIFGYDDPGARDYAVNLGLALQLTNILRDVKADLDKDRLYIPAEDLARFGCTEEDLRRGQMTAPVRALLAHQGERARQFYADARATLPRADARRLVAAEIMGAIYGAILARIERRGYDVFSEVVRIPRPRRAWIAAATWARVVAGGGASTP
jgi:phytoene synthase